MIATKRKWPTRALQVTGRPVFAPALACTSSRIFAVTSLLFSALAHFLFSAFSVFFLFAFAPVFLFAFAPAAEAQSLPPLRCARVAVGYEVRKAEKMGYALWYPAAGAEKPGQYSHGNRGLFARDAAPLRDCAPYPLVIFSHGMGGCGIQAPFFTEELARRGYVVAAPDHEDAVCGVDGKGQFKFVRPERSFFAPQNWTAENYRSRRDDIVSLLDTLLNDSKLGSLIDRKQIGVAGHSLGGYVAAGLTGAREEWRDKRFRAALLLSPYLNPYLRLGTISDLSTPVMFQGGEHDWGVTPFLKGMKGAYANAAAPKYLVVLKDGNHFEWTVLACLGAANASACATQRTKPHLITAYGIDFFERHLKGKPAPHLNRPDPGLLTFEAQE